MRHRLPTPPADSVPGNEEVTDGVADTAALRDVLGRFATGVTVITTMTTAGPVGMTANSFTSVSLDPPLVLFSVSRRSQLCLHLTAAKSFAVNILHADQRRISQQFATPGFDRFGDLVWHSGKTGAPILPGVLSVLECHFETVYDGGDHLMIIGRVVNSTAHPTAADPLIFFGGEYHRITDGHDLSDAQQ